MGIAEELATGIVQTGEVAGVSAEGLEETVFPGWEGKEGRVQLKSAETKANRDWI